MMPHQFDRALLHARFELSRFETALARLDAHQFPSDIAKTLIQQQREESRKSIEAIERIQTDFKDDPQGASARLVSEYRKLSNRRRHLEVLEKSRSDEVPWSLVPSIERIAQQILPTKQVLVTTTPDMNYMVGWNSSPDQPFVTVYLPKLHRANAFLHVLIGHELFHPAIEPFFPNERALVTPLLREDCRRVLASIHGATDLFFPKRLDSILQFALEAWEKAVTELMCDLGAAALFGPAALWTISGFAALHNQDITPSPQNQFYPPWRMRVRNVLEFIAGTHDGRNSVRELITILSTGGFEKHSVAVMDSLQREQEVAEGVDYRRSLATDQLLTKVYEYVEASIKRGADFVRQITNGLSDRWVVSLPQVPELLKRLELLVPPSELLQAGKPTSEPAQLTAIVLACWVERLVHEKEGTLGMVEFRRLCRLLLKAIEDAELKRQYCDWRTK